MTLEVLRQKLESLNEVVKALQMEEVPRHDLLKDVFGDVDGIDMTKEVSDLLSSITRYGHMNSVLQLHGLISPNWKVSNCHGPDVGGRWVVSLNKFPAKVVTNILNYVSETDKALSMAWMFTVFRAYKQELRLQEHDLLKQSAEPTK